MKQVRWECRVGVRCEFRQGDQEWSLNTDLNLGSEGDTGNSRYKGPVASVGLMCLRDSEEARVAGSEVRRNRMGARQSMKGFIADYTDIGEH